MQIPATQAEATFAQRALQGLRRGGAQGARLGRVQPLATAGFLILVVLILAAVFAPLVTGYDPNYAVVKDRFLSPSIDHWMGTDPIGRDLFTRIVYGARVSLFVAFSSILLGTSLGYLFGIFSGYVGGKVDISVQRVVDAMMAFPPLLLALTVVSALGPGVDKVIFAISMTSAPRAARVSRGLVLSLKQNVYVDAARVIGAAPKRIMLLHILPNALAPFLILASVSLGGAILTEAALSFLGLGIPPPHASWGRMLTGAARDFGLIAPWLLIFPGLAIGVVVLAFNFFGDGLRDIWDPKLRGR